MRHLHRSVEVAEAAVRWRDRGVVAFDIAGPEDGYPPDDHLEAFQYCQRENFHVTIHAGEAYGPRSIWKALQFCGAERLGHGIRIVEDIVANADGDRTLGRLAHYIRDRRIPLEVCPTSNVNTGVVASVADHPIDTLVQLRFRVTVNTDNRLMSNVSMTSEMATLAGAFGYDWARLRWLTVNAMKSSFLAVPGAAPDNRGSHQARICPAGSSPERAPCLKRRRAPGHRSCHTRGPSLFSGPSWFN